MLTSEIFNDGDRTMSAMVKRVRDSLSGKSGVSTGNAVKDGVVSNSPACGCEGSHKCASCIEAFAAVCLRASGLIPGGVHQVSDVPSACALVHAVSPEALLTDDVLRSVLDRAPGGAQFLDDPANVSRLRVMLLDKADLDRSVLGTDEIQEFLPAARKVPTATLASANLTMVDPDPARDVIHHVLRQLQDATAFSDEQYAMFTTALRNDVTLSLQGPVPTLFVIPDRATVVAALSTRLDAGALAAGMAESAVALRHVLDLSDDLAPLSASVWASLIGTWDIPCVDADPHDNLERLKRMVGGLPSLSYLRELAPQLYATLRGSLPAGRPQGSGTAKDPGAPADFAEILAFVEEYRASHDGVMPGLRAVHELAKDRLAAFELTLKRTYSEWSRDYAQPRAWKYDGRSSNEVALDAIAHAAFGDTLVSSTSEWPLQVDDARCRIDLQMELSDGRALYLEADGEGHFREVCNWDLGKAQQADHDKALALRDVVLARRADGNDGLMLALHHRTLSGPRKSRISADNLTLLTSLAAPEKAWWMFVRPAGCVEMRHAPTKGAPRRLDPVVGLEHLEAFVLTW
jgi:hypothetical protein